MERLESNEIDSEPPSITEEVLCMTLLQITDAWSMYTSAIRERDHERVTESRACLYRLYEYLEHHADFLKDPEAEKEINGIVVQDARDEIDFSCRNLNIILK